MPPQSTTPFDVLILGSGAAGLAAAVYAGRYRLDTAVLTGGEFGGETSTGGKVENYPGFLSIDGFELMVKFREQAQKLGAKIFDDTASSVEKEAHCFAVKGTSGEIYRAHALIFATGSKRRRLGLENEKELVGRGVHYCITCDGPVYGGKTIAIVGGGDASIKGANLAAEYVKKIYLIVRGDAVLAEPINLENLNKLGDKVETLLETEVRQIHGTARLEKLTLSKPYQGSPELPVDGLFVEIGAEPNTDLAKSIGMELDERGYIRVNNMMQTNVDGVFAAGDTTNFFGSFKQDITAAAMGAVAATSAYNDGKIHGEACPYHARPQGA